jgi:type IV pilus assembly protein PilP
MVEPSICESRDRRGLQKRAIWTTAFCLVLSACTSYDTSDLERFVEETRAAQKGRIDPLPQFKPFATYSYGSGALRDPFAPWQDESQKTRVTKAPGQGLQPDFNRRKEPLEAYPLDSLRMVGTLSRDDGQWAIIRAPDGVVHRIKPGNYIGQNHGKVIDLAESRIELKEIVPDGLGGWQERQAYVTLVE